MENSQKCPECGCKKLALNTDGLMCSKCGLIIFETFFSEKEKII